MKIFEQSPETLPKTIPIIPTIDVVVFPHMIVPLLVTDARIIAGVQSALKHPGKHILLLASHGGSTHKGTVNTDDLHKVGTVGSIMRLINTPEGGIKVLVQGLYTARVTAISTDNDELCADIEPTGMVLDQHSPHIAAHVKNIKHVAEKMALSGQALSPDFHMILSKMNDADKIADFLLSHISLSLEEAQQLLESPTYEEFLEGLYHFLLKEAEIAQLQERIKNRARDSMNGAQKEFYLREQLKAIKTELGDDDSQELEQFQVKLDALTLPEEARTEIQRQIHRLEKLAPESMEAGVIRAYLELALDLPWNTTTPDNLDLEHAKSVLDEDHAGLKEIKERILDFISIKNLKQDGFTPILCFSGPPGTGKTSLAQSIARALGRQYFRVALGGIKDEAEIRGHRRTYVGALPGRFIQGIRKAKTNNPVIVIDEIDKIGADFRGDPSAAMLEVLDPHQNKTFYDNYLGIPFDLSRVMFIATANRLDTLSTPLRDRMEVIQLAGYTVEEKLEIAKRHLIRRAVTECGLDGRDITLSDGVILDIIENYTHEAGVRELERQIKKLCSKLTRAFVETGTIPSVTCETLERHLGARRFIADEHDHDNKIGVANGLAWTSLGGEILKIEAVAMPGQGKLLLTGQLGDVMKESAQAALSYIRSHAQEFGISQEMFTQYDVHVHVPAGGIPKDGPSAGITLLTAMLSALTMRPINAAYAMTGEINLQGHVMAIGGVREKILAAKRNHIPHVILPKKNKHDLVEMQDLLEGVEVILVERADEFLSRVLLGAI